ncbi:MAG TPA: MarR family transcriptional regulator [Arthrobacter sp.]|jgi:DNA-binding MarR family transcriptional regulator
MNETSDYIDTVQQQWARIDPTISSEPARIIGRVRRLAELIQRRSNRVLDSYGISRDEFDILALLTRTGRPMTPSQLSADLIISGPGTTKRIRKLVAAGLVTREPDPSDGRGALIRMTAEAEAMILPVLRSVSAFEGELVSSLAATDREELARLLRTLLISVEAADPEAGTASRTD